MKFLDRQKFTAKVDNLLQNELSKVKLDDQEIDLYVFTVSGEIKKYLYDGIKAVCSRKSPYDFFEIDYYIRYENNEGHSMWVSLDNLNYGYDEDKLRRYNANPPLYAHTLDELKEKAKYLCVKKEEFEEALNEYKRGQ